MHRAEVSLHLPEQAQDDMLLSATAHWLTESGFTSLEVSFLNHYVEHILNEDKEIVQEMKQIIEDSHEEEKLEEFIQAVNKLMDFSAKLSGDVMQ